MRFFAHLWKEKSGKIIEEIIIVTLVREFSCLGLFPGFDKITSRAGKSAAWFGCRMGTKPYQDEVQALENCGKVLGRDLVQFIHLLVCTQSRTS